MPAETETAAVCARILATAEKLETPDATDTLFRVTQAKEFAADLRHLLRCAEADQTPERVRLQVLEQEVVFLRNACEQAVAMVCGYMDTDSRMKEEVLDPALARHSVAMETLAAVLRAMCDVTPETAPGIIATDDTVILPPPTGAP